MQDTFARRKWIAAIVLPLVTLCLAASPAGAGENASISIVGGERTSIRDWPWQVALLRNHDQNPNLTGTERMICSGTILAPRIVLTAGHCIDYIDRNDVGLRNTEVVAGRTNLDRESSGTVAPVEDDVRPLGKSGKPRNFLKDASWDIALLELASPLDQPAIKLLGADEAHLANPGRVVHMSGWGTRGTSRTGGPVNRLRHAVTAIQPDRACRGRFDKRPGKPYGPATQMCVGDPDTQSIPCVGDSGGPAVIETSDGYRLVGVGSLGLLHGCFPWDPLVNADVTRRRTRDWIAGIVRDRGGVDPVGSGATAGPLPEYCRLPRIEGRKLPAVRKSIRRGGCMVGSIRFKTIRRPGSHPDLQNTVIGGTGASFTLRDPENPVDLVVARRIP